MTDAQRHYADILAPVYRWSLGPDLVARTMSWLQSRDLIQPGLHVLDLGAGFGTHTLPLARAGAQVTAVDMDAHLLSELRADLETHDVQAEVIHGDIIDFTLQTEETWDLVLCLGDTLTHLTSHEDLHRMLTALADTTRPGGRVILSWRDTTGALPQDVSRFMEVATDAHRTMHCMIEALDARHLRVTDLVTQLEEEGPRTRIGSYQKLRVGKAEIEHVASDAGFRVEYGPTERGFTELHLHREG